MVKDLSNWSISDREPPSPSAGLQIRGGTENNLANFTPY